MSKNTGEPITTASSESSNLPDKSHSIWGKYEEFNAYLYSVSDPRSRDLFLLGRMDGMILVTLSYLLFVYVGPKWMKHRKPFELRGIMAVYNVFLVGLSAWMFLTFLINSQISGYNFWCVPYSLSYAPSELKIVYALWWYYVSKSIEYMDTVFMILKKKQDQVTFLHVYHHAFMFPVFYFILMIGPCCQAVFAAMLNSFIHVVMYSYYVLAVFPALRKFLWWKRYLTQMQLLQFAAILTTTTWGYMNSCQYSPTLHLIEIVFLSSLVVLFSNFYIHSYVKKKRDPRYRLSDDHLHTKDVSTNGYHGKLHSAKSE